MTTEVGRIHIVDVEAGAQVPPEGHHLYARDTDKEYKSDGTTLTELAGGGAYTNEEAQDAVGSMVDATLTYVDATPSLGVAANGIGNTHIRDSAALSVIGRSANSSGDPADIAGATVGHVLQVLSGPTVGFNSVETTFPSWMNQYNPNRPPSSVGTGGIQDEFIGGVTMTFNGWGNQESSTATAERDGLTIYHPIDTTGLAIYWFTGPDGSSTDWVFHTRISAALWDSFNQVGITILATGTEAAPTRYYYLAVGKSGANSVQYFARNATSFTVAAAVGVDQPSHHDTFIALHYTSSTKVLNYLTSSDGYLYKVHTASTLAAHPTTSFGLVVGSINGTYAAYGHFHFIRVRTDANMLEAGE